MVSSYLIIIVYLSFLYLLFACYVVVADHQTGLWTDPWGISLIANCCGEAQTTVGGAISRQVVEQTRGKSQ